jgi:hypothetical protein
MQSSQHLLTKVRYFRIILLTINKLSNHSIIDSCGQRLTEWMVYFTDN